MFQLFPFFGCFQNVLDHDSVQVCVYLVPLYPKESVGFTFQIHTQMGHQPPAPHCASTLPREKIGGLQDPSSACLASVSPFRLWPSNTAAFHWDLALPEGAWPLPFRSQLSCHLHQENFLALPKQLGASHLLLHIEQVLQTQHIIVKLPVYLLATSITA